MRTLTAAVVTLSLLASSPDAQELEFPAASPNATVQERVGLTDVTITYARPSVRGREIFGELVPYGEVWRTGANAATTVTFSTDVTFGGEDVPAGTYALFTIPGEREWTVILNAGAQQWGSYAYDELGDIVRVKARAQTLDHAVETFTIGVGNMTGDAAHLTLAWDTTQVAVPIEVDIAAVLVPQIEAAMASGENLEQLYFPAAMFYYAHDVDIDKAVEWIDEAARLQPNAVWVIYRKGLVHAKAGHTDVAMEAAQASLEMAKQVPGELGEEYVRLNEMLLAQLRAEG